MPGVSGLFVGDVCVDIVLAGLEKQLQLDREVLATEMRRVPGSSAIIAASHFASLGGETALIGLSGDDENGRWILERAVEMGIDISRVETTSKFPTGVTVNLVHQQTRTQVTVPGTIAEFDGNTLDQSSFQGVGIVHFAGIYQQHKLRGHLRRLVSDAKATGAIVTIDPQWDQTETWEGLVDLGNDIDILFVNADEACSIAQESNPERAAEALSKMFQLAVVKLGEEGACVFDDTLVRARGYDVSITDTIGAGDAFDAGFLIAKYGLGYETDRALSFGSAAGAYACTGFGGCGARATVESIERMITTR